MGSETKIGIVGLGLIGGSIAAALKNSGGYKVAGFDIDETVMKKAISADVIDSCDMDEIYSADIIVVALAPNRTINWINSEISKIKKGAVITDVCGVKQVVVAECEQVCAEFGVSFVGGHPMAGKEKGGFDNVDKMLFSGASYIITPTEFTNENAVLLVKKLAGSLGCDKVTVTTPSEHDRMLAFTSHLPHVLAGAYILSPQSVNHNGYSAGSFRDVSRVAAVDENLWTELFIYNREFLGEEISLLVDNLEKMKVAIESSDFKKVGEIIKSGRCKKAEVMEADSCKTQKKMNVE